MGIQDRKYMNRDEQRRYADKFKMDGGKRKGPTKAPPGSSDYNNTTQHDINVNRPKAKYDEYAFDESDSIPKRPQYRQAGVKAPVQPTEDDLTISAVGWTVLAGLFAACFAWIIFIIR